MLRNTSDFLKIVALLFPLVVGSLRSHAALSSKPNVLIILSDDIGYSELGCYRGEYATPNLDALAANGLRFTQFYNSATCKPTRSSLMSGQYWQNCSMGTKDGITMGQAMKAAGYATFAIGKWHLDGNPSQRWLDHYFGHLSEEGNSLQGSPSHRLDGAPFHPKNGPFYTTAANAANPANADYAIRVLGESQKQPSTASHSHVYRAA